LSTSMGIAGQFENPAFRAALAQIEEAVKAAGKLLGSIATAVDDVAALRGRGYQFIISSSDVLLLRDAACQDAKRAKEP